MAVNDDSKDKKTKKSIIASLDLKNYKAKYTDSYGLGKPNEIDIDNFLVAEPDSKSEAKNESSKPVEKKIDTPEKTIKIKSTPKKSSDNPAETKSVNEIVKEEPVVKPVESKVISEVINNNDDFDKRVNAEAENDFYDEKPVQVDNSAFRSKVVNRSTQADVSEEPLIKIEKKGSRKLNLRDPIKVNVRHEIQNDKFKTEEILTNAAPEKEPQRRTETYGIIISAIALIYSFSTADRPLLFLSASLMLFLARSIVAAPFGKYSQSIQNAIKGFSIVLFFGAIFLIFF